MDISDYLVTYTYATRSHLSFQFITEISNFLDFHRTLPIIFFVNYPDNLQVRLKIKTVPGGFELTQLHWTRDCFIDKFKTLDNIFTYLDSRDLINLLVAPQPLVPIGSIVFGFKLIGYNEGPHTKWRAYKFENEPIFGVSEKLLDLKSNTEVNSL